jgi:hypothetical protein
MDIDVVPELVRPGARRTPTPPKSPWEWEDFPEFIAFLEVPPAHPHRRELYDPFLKHLATYGEKSAAAMYARIGRSSLYDYVADDPAFAAEVTAALEFYRARCRYSLMHNTRTTGNPVGAIVTNKAEEPAKYIEKHAVVSLNMTAEVPGVDIAAVLRAMLGDLTEPTQQLLAHGPLPALPDATQTP